MEMKNSFLPLIWTLKNDDLLWNKRFLSNIGNRNDDYYLRYYLKLLGIFYSIIR